MARKFCLLTVLGCIFVMSNANAEILESGQISFIPKEAVKCRSSSPTLYVPFSTLELDITKTSTPVKLDLEKLSERIIERCVMGPYAPPCWRFCDQFRSELMSDSPVLAPIRKIHREIYFESEKQINSESFCMRQSQELIEVDYLGQKLVDVKILAEEKVDMSYCQNR